MIETRAPMIFRALMTANIAMLIAGCGPVPGGSLAGKPTSTPADWSEALGGEKAFCEIESRPGAPHSIQLECFEYGDRLHVHSHRWVFASWWPVESWAEIWLGEPDLLVRIDDALYEVSAVLVSEPEERSAVLRYRGYDRIPDGIAVFRFDPRP